MCIYCVAMRRSLFGFSLPYLYLKAWAASQGHSLYELAIAWTLANSAVTSCIVGAKTPEQAVQNAAATDWILTQDALQKLDQIQGGFRVLNLHH